MSKHIQVVQHKTNSHHVYRIILFSYNIVYDRYDFRLNDTKVFSFTNILIHSRNERDEYYYVVY